MRIKELRALLNLLPKRFDDLEVHVAGGRGLNHVGAVELARQRSTRRSFPGLDNTPDDRFERKLIIEGSQTLWYYAPPEWCLKGWWPKGAENVGIPFEGDDLDAL